MASRYVVDHLNHLEIVAEVCREIGVADWLDQQEPGNRQQVSAGTVTVALVLSNRQLYLVPQFFADKPVTHLLGPGIALFAGLALRARRAFGVGVSLVLLALFLVAKRTVWATGTASTVPGWAAPAGLALVAGMLLSGAVVGAFAAARRLHPTDR
jgi:hypothetical protein